MNKLPLHSIIRFLMALVLVAAVVTPADLCAKNNKKKKSKPRSTKGAASELPTVKSISGDIIVIGNKTYQISSSTVITVNGQSTSIGAIKSGMQASVAGSVLTYGATSADTIYKATRISARADNKLDAKRKAFNKKQGNKNNNKNRNRR